MTKRRILRFAALISAAAFLLPACSPKHYNQNPDKPIVILYDNDAHCAVDGYPYLATLKTDMKKEGNYVLLASAGDYVQGGSLGAASKGSYITELMNSVGYDVVTLGNHEFDYGMPRLAEITKELQAEIVDCNLYDLRTGQLMYKPYKMFKFGNIDVAMVGVSTPYSFISSSPSYFLDENGNMAYSLRTEDIYDVVQATVDDARKAGAEYVFAITHLGDDEEATEINSLELAKHTSGIDAILDGHSHSYVPSSTLKNKEGKDVIMSSTGAYLANFGKLTIGTDGSIKTELVPRENVKTEDAATAAILARVKAEYAVQGERVIGSSQAEMINDLSQERPRAQRFQEMGIGDFCCDALKIAMRTDIAVTGGGGIRAPIHKGTLTFNDLFTVFPFGNTIATAEMTGQQILDMLEFSVYCLPIEFGGFLQVSGLKFDVDLSVPTPVIVDNKMVFTGFKDAPRRVKNVMFENAEGELEPLDLNRKYSLAAFSYLLLEHGDGFDVLNDVTAVDTGMLDLQLLEKYLIEELGGVIPAKYTDPAGRINIIK